VQCFPRAEKGVDARNDGVGGKAAKKARKRRKIPDVPTVKTTVLDIKPLTRASAAKVPGK
jgi:hypothetical protein